MACISGNTEIVKKLVQGGADTGAQDTANETPFYEASRNKHHGIVVSMLSILRSNISSIFRSLFRVFVFSAVEPHTPRLRFAGGFIEAFFFFFFFFLSSHLYPMDLIITILPVTKDLPISPRFTPYNFFIAMQVQHSYNSSTNG